MNYKKEELENNIVQYTMNNEELEVRFLNIGGALTFVSLKKDEFKKNLLVNFDDINSYITNDCYLNVIVGRTSNRIKDGVFSIDGKEYQLDLNEPTNNLHGGKDNISHTYLEVKEIENGYSLHTILKEQELGFPGDVSIEVHYTLEGSALKIEYFASTNKKTIVNLTHHAYFNLSGNLERDVSEHNLMIDADYIAVVDKNQSFTKEVQDVTTTIFDFRVPKEIGLEGTKDLPEFTTTLGYDHCYLLNNTNECVAILEDKESNHKVEVFTSSPSLQFYAGNFMNENQVFEPSIKGRKHLGCCLETHLVPYDFDSQIIDTDTPYQAYVTYKFS